MIGMEKVSYLKSRLASDVGNDICEEETSPPSDRPAFSMRDLVDTFPEAKKVVKEMVKEDERALRIYEEAKDRIRNWLYPRVKMEDLDIMTALFCIWLSSNFIEHKSQNKLLKEGEYVSDRLERNRKLLRLWEMPKQMTADFGAKIARAKTYPIENLVKMDRSGFAKCMLHAEQTGSFKVYKKENKWHCFGCSTGGDVIDLVGRIQNLSFKEAVEKLC